MFWKGIDAYRCDNGVFLNAFVSAGIGAIGVDIPGTGGSPCNASRPPSADRQIDTLLTWCTAQPYIDKTRLAIWGVSTGAFYSIRAAHTHRENLLACVAQGGAAHHVFDKEWLDEIDHLEF